MNKAFFFDKDGVLNEGVYREDYYKKGKFLNGAPIDIKDLKIKPDAKKTITLVKQKGFIPVIVTNQPDFLGKDVPLKKYEEMITKICETIDIPKRNIFTCLHKNEIGLPCNCKKPKPDLFLMAKGVFDIDMKSSWVIGDSWKDLEAFKEV